MENDPYSNLNPDSAPYYITSLTERFFLHNFQFQQNDFSVVHYTSIKDYSKIDAQLKSGSTMYLVEIKIRQYSLDQIKRYPDNSLVIEKDKYSTLVHLSNQLGMKPMIITVLQPDTVVIHLPGSFKPLSKKIKRNDGKSFNSTGITSTECYLLPLNKGTYYQSEFTIDENILLARKRLHKKTGNDKYLLENIIKHRPNKDERN